MWFVKGGGTTTAYCLSLELRTNLKTMTVMKIKKKRYFPDHETVSTFFRFEEIILGVDVVLYLNVLFLYEFYVLS